MPLRSATNSTNPNPQTPFLRPNGNPVMTVDGPDLAEALLVGIPLDVIEEWLSGARLLWTSRPPQSFRENYSSLADHSAVVTKELARLRGLGKLRLWRGPGRPRVVSPMGCVVKGDKIRVILDMTASGVNDCLHCPHFAMASVGSALRNLRAGDWMAKVDLTDAFLNFKLREEDYELFGIQDPDTGLFYTYTHLPFGCSISPYIFVYFCDHLHDALRRAGLDELIVYVDDWMIIARSQFECELRMKVLLRFFRRINISTKQSKEIPPSQRTEFLGVTIDTVKCTVELTPAKLAETRDLVDTALSAFKNGTPISGSFWHSLTGKLSFAGAVVRAGRTFIRRMWDLGSLHLQGKRRRACAAASFVVSREAASDLRWWRSALASHTGVRLWLSEVTSHLSLWRPGEAASGANPTAQSDASGFAWGFVDGSERRAGQWTAAQARQHINWKELKTIEIACKWRGPYWTGTRVLLEVDNTCAAGYANRGYGRIAHLSSIARRIKLLEARYNFELVIRHLAGILNVIADTLSRNKLAASTQEWVLDKTTFLALERDFGPHSADLMADPEGRCAMLPVFFSQANSLFDADIVGLNSYVNPPWDDIEQVLLFVLAAHARSPRDTHATIVLPEFLDRPWWRLGKHFKTVRRFEKGTHLFRTRDLSLQTPSDTLVDVGPTRWPVVVWRV